LGDDTITDPEVLSSNDLVEAGENLRRRDFRSDGEGTGPIFKVAETRYGVLGLRGEYFKMLRGVVVSAALLSMLSGCAAPSAQLTNDKGQEAKCSSFGFGVLGTLFAVSTYQTCVDQY
jgi:hypothetical protein